MKKLLALTLAGMLVLGGSGAVISTAYAAERPDANQTREGEAQTETKLYLVPGTYVSEGAKIENAISSGAQKLTAEECNGIYTENAYLCTLAEGAALPVPTSDRLDKNGAPYKFNGWWSIVDATVTYFDKVPSVSETTYLYADWRADLSQRKDPVIPDESNAAKPMHYMSIKRAATGKEEIETLRVSGTDMSTADNLGFDRPVQLYNGWFELNPGDVITVYSAGLGGAEEVGVAPLAVTGRGITLETNGTGTNATSDFLEVNKSLKLEKNLTVTYKSSLQTRPFRIYIKFFNDGKTMTMYMEPMDLT